MSEERNRGQYVRRVQEGNRRYTLDILSENETLRSLLAEREAERDRLRERLAVLEPYLSESAGLRVVVGQLERDKGRLEDQLIAAHAEIRGHETERLRLQRGLARVEEENRKHAQQHSLVEQQNSDLANLYVASYRLHGALDRAELITILHEIIANIIGCEENAIFERRPGENVLHLVGSVGIDPEGFRTVALGEGIVGRCAESGTLFVADSSSEESRRPEEAHLSACVPLSLHGEVTGAIALFRLLPQKVSGYEDLDREVFDLLGTHAASALYCSALHDEKCHRTA